MGSVAADIGTSAAWMAKALSSAGFRADFSGPSLWEVDRFFDVQAPDGVVRPTGLLGSDPGPKLFAVGAYIGEVVRRSVGGIWRLDDPGTDPPSVAFQLPDNRPIWPVARATTRLHDPTASIAAYGLSVGVPVGRQPPPGGNVSARSGRPRRV